MSKRESVMRHKTVAKEGEKKIGKRENRLVSSFEVHHQTVQNTLGNANWNFVPGHWLFFFLFNFLSLSLSFILFYPISLPLFYTLPLSILLSPSSSSSFPTQQPSYLLIYFLLPSHEMTRSLSRLHITVFSFSPSSTFLIGLFFSHSILSCHLLCLSSLSFFSQVSAPLLRFSSSASLSHEIFIICFLFSFFGFSLFQFKRARQLGKKESKGWLERRWTWNNGCRKSMRYQRLTKA